MSTVLVGEHEYELVKTGRALAEQSLGVVRWLAKYGKAALAAIGEDKNKPRSGLDFLADFVASLPTDSIIDLFVLLTGCTKEEAEVYFTPDILIDAGIAVYNDQPSVRRLLDRFFSELPANSSTEKSSTQSE